VVHLGAGDTISAQIDLVERSISYLINGLDLVLFIAPRMMLIIIIIFSQGVAFTLPWEKVYVNPEINWLSQCFAGDFS
jgi:hypothetical protein